MPKKTFTPEQIVGKLRQIEVLMSQGKTVRWRVKIAGSRIRPTTVGGESTAACNWSRLRSSRICRRKMRSSNGLWPH